MSNYIDPTTLQPPRFAELFSDRSIVVTGAARWVSPNITSSGIKVILTPRGGGALSECSLPDASYALSADGASLWVQVNRDPGAHALTSQVYAAGSMPKLTGDWIPLFIRHAGVVYAYGGLQVSPFMHEIGAVNKISDYEYVVHATDPRSTHSTIQSAIQQAITDNAEGARILVLNGTYDAGAGMSAGVGFYWSGITLCIEGEGWGTIITNSGGLTTAFGIGSFSATPTAMAGNGSRILNLRTQGFAQPVTLVAGFLGIRNCVVDVWAGANSSYTDPSISGGLGSANDVTVRIYANTALNPPNQVKRYILGTDTALVLHGQTGLDGLLAGPTTANLLSGTVIAGAITSGAGGYVVVTDERKMLRPLAFSHSPSNLGGIKTSLVLRNQLGDIEANKAVFTELNLSTLALDTTDDNYLLRVAAVAGGDVGTIKYSISSEPNTIILRNASQKIFVGDIDADDIVASTLKLSGLAPTTQTTVLVINGSGVVSQRTGAFNTDFLLSYLSENPSPPANSIGFRWADPDADWLVPWANGVTLDSPLFGVLAGNFKATSRYKGSHGASEGVALQVDSSNQLTFKWFYGTGPVDDNGCDLTSYNGGPRRGTAHPGVDISCYGSCSANPCLGFLFGTVTTYEYGAQLQLTIDDSLCFGLTYWLDTATYTLEACY